MPPRSRCRESSAGTWPIPRRGDAPSRISCRSQARTSSCSPGSGISGRRCGHAHRAWSAEIRAMGRPPAHMHRGIRPRRPGTGKDGARHMPSCASPLRASRRQPWRCRHMSCGSPPIVPVGRVAGGLPHREGGTAYRDDLAGLFRCQLYPNKAPAEGQSSTAMQFGLVIHSRLNPCRTP